jgi:hypothetical protein
MTYTDEELTKLSFEAQVANDERRKKYGVIGIKQLSDPSRHVIPTSEQGKRVISVTLEDGTIVKADAGRVIPVAGARVTVRIESNRWIILGADDREALSTSSNTTINTTRHHHNIGAPSGLFYPVDPASMNDGMLLPTGNALEVTVGRVTYPKDDGTIGIYDSNGTLDFASAVTGLNATSSRWAITYIDKSDGSVDYHIATAGTAPLNTTTDLEDAIADCLNNVADAYPYHAVRIRAGLSVFSSYKMMQGRSMESKDFIRLGSVSGSGQGNNSASDLTTRFEPLAVDGELVFVGGDVVMIEVSN